MQRTLAIDGVEWAAADMTFDQTGRINAVLNRTKLWAGTGGVFTGGAVANPAGFTITISGPLKFHANGELAIINAPANVTASPSTTNYIIAVYQETQDTPATYYGGGSPPNIHANETPTVICRGTPAVLANGEVPLATVVTNGSTSTSINDTRVILPTCDNAGNLILGAGATIDGMDPSVHQALAATGATLGHVTLGPGGVTPYNTLGGAWLREEFLDVGSAFGATKVLDDADFGAPPVSSQPYVGTGNSLLYLQSYVPTRFGELILAGSNVRVCSRYTLTFTATSVFSVQLYLNYWDDTVRVKGNGTSLYNNNSPNSGTCVPLNFNTIIGTNTIQVYHYNNTGVYNLNLITSVLQHAGVVFTG